MRLHAQVREALSGSAAPGTRIADRRPTPAERARTLVSGHLTAHVRVPWLEHGAPVNHLADPDGDLALFITNDHPLARVACLHSAVSATVQVQDVAPHPAPDRLRGYAEIGGTLTALPPPLVSPRCGDTRACGASQLIATKATGC